MKSKNLREAIDVSLCQDNCVELNVWDNDVQAWRPPSSTSAPETSRRAHELFCVPCGKHIMPSQLQDHLDQEKHDRALTWFKTQKHRMDKLPRKSAAFPPPPARFNKCPAPPPSSKKKCRSRSRSPIQRTRAPVEVEPAQQPLVDDTVEQLDDQFNKSLPGFMIQKNVLPDGPKFYPEGFMETKAKSTSVSNLTLTTSIPEPMWRDWVPPPLIMESVPPPLNMESEPF